MTEDIDLLAKLLNSDIGNSLKARLSPAAISQQLQCSDYGDRMQLLARDALIHIRKLEGLLGLSRLETRVERLKGLLTPHEREILDKMSR